MTFQQVQFHFVQHFVYEVGDTRHQEPEGLSWLVFASLPSLSICTEEEGKQRKLCFFPLTIWHYMYYK